MACCPFTVKRRLGYRLRRQIFLPEKLRTLRVQFAKHHQHKSHLKGGFCVGDPYWTSLKLLIIQIQGDMKLRALFSAIIIPSALKNEEKFK